MMFLHPELIGLRITKWVKAIQFSAFEPFGSKSRPSGLALPVRCRDLEIPLTGELW